MASYLDSTGVTSLTSDIKALTDAAYPANATIINGYSSSSAYSVGDFCIHGGLFYKCNTAIASGGETWNSSHWTQTNVTSEWGTKMVVLSYGNNTWADFLAAFNANAIVYCKASSNSNPGTGSQGRMAFMAFVNYSGSTPTNVEFQYYRSVSSHSDSQQGDQVFIYKLESTNGGTWSVTTREAATKMVAGTGLSSSYSSGTLTMSVASAYQIPSGGTTGQVLAKKTNTDRDLEWVNQSGGGGSGDLMVVKITRSGTYGNYTYTADQTFADMKAHVVAGKPIILVDNNNAQYTYTGYMFGSASNPTTLVFTLAQTAESSGYEITVPGQKFYVSSNSISFYDKTVSVGNATEPVYVIHIGDDGAGNYSVSWSTLEDPFEQYGGYGGTFTLVYEHYNGISQILDRFLLTKYYFETTEIDENTWEREVHYVFDRIIYVGNNVKIQEFEVTYNDQTASAAEDGVVTFNETTLTLPSASGVSF